jgi:hypothetical protein
MSYTLPEQLPRQDSRLPKTIGTALIGWRKELRKSDEQLQIPAFHDLNPRTPSITVTHIPMASRRLALNLTQGLRNRAALNAVAPLKRGFATPVVKNGVKTESTTLSNGLTVGMGIRRDGSF